MWRKPSFYLFSIAILLVFGTFYVPFVIKGAYIWVLGSSGCLLSIWTIRQSPSIAQRFMSVFIAASFLAFCFILSKAFQIFT